MHTRDVTTGDMQGAIAPTANGYLFVIKYSSAGIGDSLGDVNDASMRLLVFAGGPLSHHDRCHGVGFIPALAHCIILGRIGAHHKPESFTEILSLVGEPQSETTTSESAEVVDSVSACAILTQPD